VRYQMKWGGPHQDRRKRRCLSKPSVDVPQLTLEEMSAIVSEAHKWRAQGRGTLHGDAAARIAIERGWTRSSTAVSSPRRPLRS